MESKILPEFSKYIIYSDGRIWSISKNVWVSSSLNTDGYPSVNLISYLAKNDYRQVICVHRVVAMAFCENPNNHKEVNHIDGNKHNNNFTNLEWCDRSHNVKHTYKLGLRSQKGVNNGNYKTGKYVL